ncbi:MAG: sulfatase-like hydrolase/transferase [Verrucomicrobiales bacterium]|nr:sulfatase-like hydrolase/transferase [Verrucomicrobiales bacterium]
MIKPCWILLLFACCFSPVLGQEKSRKPNVLMLLVDDLKPALGAYGDDTAKTPHLDALADQGMRFDLAYCNQAVCAPSRFTLMLGSHSTSTGLYGLGSSLRDVLPEAVTLPQYFAKHGYRTESLGKVFHVGHGNLGDPESFSVPHFKEKVIEYVDPASTQGGKLTREEAFFTNQRLGEVNSLPRGAAYEMPDVPDEAYADGRVAAETSKRLEAAKQRRERDGTPFFIVSGFARPHLPFSAPKKYWDLYDPEELPMPEREDLPDGAPGVAGKRGGEIRNYFPVPDKGDPAQISEEVKRSLIHGYYASTSYVDAQIGKVLSRLEELGLSENTIVVLWGDHGFHLGDLGIWTKHTNYEQANRIPLVIQAPGVSKSGSSTRQPAESVDLFPTLVELAGLPEPDVVQPIDGVSLVPVLKDPEARVRDHAFHAYPKGKMGRAIRTERYRLVEWKSPGADPSTAEVELYDYEIDPLESKNLAEEKPKVVAELLEKLSAYPEAVSRSRNKAPKKSPTTEAAAERDVSLDPKIADRPIRVLVEAKAPDPHGVVLAQGGKEHGYAIHFIDGVPAFDVRIREKVTRLEASEPMKGRVKVEGRLTKKKMSLRVNGELIAEIESPGFIPVQPQDGVSVGLDTRTAAGAYEAPNSFNGMISNTRIEAGGEPPAIAKPMSKEEIRKGFASHDRALFVHSAWIRDPYVVRGPDDAFYLTGTTPNEKDSREKKDPYNSGLGEESLVGSTARVWKSKDLAHWEELGPVYSLEDGIWASAKPKAFEEVETGQWRLWAPELHWIPEVKKWALVHTSPSPVKGANFSFSAGEKVEGPWTNPMGEKVGMRHDPSLFRDEDGSWWMVWGATSIGRIKPDFSGLAGEPIRIGPSGATAKMGHEGCLIMKIEGKYVLFGTGWSTGQMRRGSYNLYYATADRIEGPYSERKFAGRFLGHGTPFQDAEGRWWCTAFYNGNIPPVSRMGIEERDLGVTAQTINQRGTTMVPLDVRLLDSGELHIRAKDPAYATPGPDEAQDFGIR